MHHRQARTFGLIGLLLLTHAGCNGVSDPDFSSRGSRAASPDVTDAQLAAFNKAIMAPPAALMKQGDVKNAFAEAVQRALGPDKTSLEEARRIRDRTLEFFDSSIEEIKAAPTPYVPEAWALKQSCMSFFGAMRDISSVYFNETIDLAQDDTLSAEVKSNLGSQAFLRQKQLMESAARLQGEAESAWEAWMNKRSSSN